VSGGIIQSATKNSSAFRDRFRSVSSSESYIESEQPTVADLVAPGSGRSIYSELDCLLELLIANGERS
jgi:hypothetical protein